MRASARRSPPPIPYDDDPYGPGELSAGERVGPPLVRRGRKAMLRGLLLMVLLGGGWALIGEPATWPEWLRGKVAAISAAMERKSGPPQQAASAMATAARPSPVEPSSKLAAIEAPPAILQPPPSARPAAAQSPAPPVTAALGEVAAPARAKGVRSGSDRRPRPTYRWLCCRRGWGPHFSIGRAVVSQPSLVTVTT